MASVKLARAASALYLFHLNGHTLYGMADGWPVVLTKNTLTVTAQIDAEARKALRAVPHVRKVTAEGSVLTVFFRPMRRKFFTDTVRAVLGELTALGIKPDDRCPLCGNGDCDSAAIVNRVYCKTHAACINDMEKRDAKKRKNFFPGFLGMLVGMLVGTLPRILTFYLTYVRHPDSYGVSYFLYYVYSAIITMIVCLTCYAGYRLLHGRMSPGIFLITLLFMVLLSVFVVEFEAYAMTVMADYAYPVSSFFYLLGELMLMPELWKDIALDNIPCFAFAIFCALIMYRMITQDYNFDETPGSVARSSLSRLPKTE